MYLQPPEIINFYDSKKVAEIFSDVRVPADLNDLANNTILTQCIYRACSAINASLENGGRYAPTDLQNIVNAANAGGAQEADILRAMPIKELTAHLAYGYGLSRRGIPADSWAKLAPMYDQALVTLQALADGQAVLDWSPNVAAGVPSVAIMGQTAGSIVVQNRMFAWNINRYLQGSVVDSQGNYYG